MTVYQKFRRLPICFSSIGFSAGQQAAYFCTPKGARILGWAGVDGIHYCTIRGHGETVYAVEPMGLPGREVHPIARSFEDLLRLLLACGSFDAVAQAWQWDEEAFSAYLLENRPTASQKKALDVIARRLKLQPIFDSYDYLQALSTAFDPASIPYTEDYYDPDMNPAAVVKSKPWRVVYESGRAGMEIPLGRRFCWGKERWSIPAVYACAKGLVADLCVEIDPAQVKACVEKYQAMAQQNLSPAEVRSIRREDPLDISFSTQFFVNGKPLQTERGHGHTWLSEDCLEEGTRGDAAAERFVQHYGLDPTRCWSLHRIFCRWATERRPKISSLRLHLEREKRETPGEVFATPAVGESVTFCHPVTGTEHRLTVREIASSTLSMPRDEWEYLEHCLTMEYLLEPDLDGRDFSLCDCADGDAPREKDPDQHGPRRIGGAMAVGVVSGQASPGLHAACSALHFAPVETVRWQPVFYICELPPLDIDLI